MQRLPSNSTRPPSLTTCSSFMPDRRSNWIWCMKEGNDTYRPPLERLRAVEEYIEEHLDGCPTLAQLAAVVRLNPYHFARQFKAATGLPPHQYVILRRVERAKQLLQAGTDLSLAEVALHAGFSD